MYLLAPSSAKVRSAMYLLAPSSAKVRGAVYHLAPSSAKVRSAMYLLAPSSAKVRGAVYLFLYSFIACTGVALILCLLMWGYAVAQLVEALRYQLEGRGFDYQWGHRDFSLTSGRTMALGPTQPLTDMSTRSLS